MNQNKNENNNPLFIIPYVMPDNYYGDDYDIDTVKDFVIRHEGKIDIYKADIADYTNDLQMKDFTFDAVSDKMHDKYKSDKIFLLCFSHSSPYGLHYSAKYPDHVVGVICYPLRLYAQESYDRRIWKFKTRKGWEKSNMSKYNVDKDWINANDGTLKKLRKNMGVIETEVTYAIFDLNLQKQWADIPRKFKVDTYLFSRLDMDVESIIRLNFERKEIADMKAITSKEDALLNSMMWNFDRVKLDKELLNQNGDNLRIHHIIGGINTTRCVIDALKIMMGDFFSSYRYKYHKYKYKYEKKGEQIKEDEPTKEKSTKQKNVAKKIILITGPSGSGKTTLGNIIEKKIGNKVVVIDSDEIDDSSFLELYSTNSEFKKMIENDEGDPQKIHGELNKKKRDRIIEENKDKIIVFVGLTIPLDDLVHTGYSLDVSPETNFKQVNTRTIGDICDNRSDIIKTIQEENPNALELLTLYKYKQRQKFPIPYDDVKAHSEHFKTFAKEKGYKTMTADDAFDDIVQLIEKM